MTVDSHEDSPSDQGRVAIVTGAGRGIGSRHCLGIGASWHPGDGGFALTVRTGKPG